MTISQQDIEIIQRGMLNQHHDSYTQGIVDTILTMQQSLKAIEEIGKDEMSYKVMIRLVNSMIAEKIYGNIPVNDNTKTNPVRYKIL